VCVCVCVCGRKYVHAKERMREGKKEVLTRKVHRVCKCRIQSIYNGTDRENVCANVEINLYTPYSERKQTREEMLSHST